jgi:asparagine synthase (glutamine-hydrolysing)
MRGLAGIIRSDGQEVDEATFARLVERMTFGQFVGTCEHPNRGMAMMAVVRPMVPEDRHSPSRHESADGNVVLVTDALLSNRRDLAGELGWSEERLAEAPDSALVMAAYERWGEGCPVKLEGHWTCAVWLRRERRLFCAVDAFSFRPLYYHLAGGVFTFASTLRGVLATPGLTRKLNERALLRHLVVVRDQLEETLYEGVLRLPAAHTLTWDAGGGPVIQQYWQPDPAHRVECGSREEYLAGFQSEMEQAVAFAVRSTGNVGILLSGGLDSTAVAVMAADILEKQGKRLQVIHNLPPSADPRRARLREHDESAWVRMLEPHLPSADFHYRTENVKEPLPMAEWGQLFDIHQVPLKGVPMKKDEEHVRWLADLGITAMTNGLGGNYLVSLEALPSGYLTELVWRGRWPTLWREAKGCREFYGHSGRHILQQTLIGPLRRTFRRQPLAPARAQMLRSLHPRLGSDAYIADRLSRVGGGPIQNTEWQVKKRMAQIMTGLIPQNVGASSSAFSPDFTVSGCAPMLDRRLNEFCLGVPLEQQIKGGRDRLLMRDSLAGRVPEALRWRVTRGLPTPSFWARFTAQQVGFTSALQSFRDSDFVQNYLQVDEMERLLKLAVPKQNTTAARTVSELVMTGRFLQWFERDAT